MKTSELTGNALDWAVGEALTWSQAFINLNYPDGFHPSTNWAQGGVIIEREGIGLHFGDGTWGVAEGVWEASHPECLYVQRGETPLIASMRAYVASKLGDEVDIPDELLTGGQYETANKI